MSTIAIFPTIAFGSAVKRVLYLLTLAMPMVGQGLSREQDSLKILSWNIQMLPRLVNNNGKAKRARVIVDQLRQKDYDVIVFQELFRKQGQRIILKGLAEKYKYQTPILNKKTISLKTNGGVILLSKHPIREVHQIRYKQRTGFDRLSRKGALLAEIDFHALIVHQGLAQYFGGNIAKHVLGKLHQMQVIAPRDVKLHHREFGIVTN